MIKNNLGLGCCVQFVVFGSLRVVLPSSFRYLLTSMRSGQIEFFISWALGALLVLFIRCKVMETSFGPSALAPCSATFPQVASAHAFFCVRCKVMETSFGFELLSDACVLSAAVPIHPPYSPCWSWHHDHHIMIIIWWSLHDDHHMTIIIWWSSSDDHHKIIIGWSSYDDHHIMIVTWYERRTDRWMDGWETRCHGAARLRLACSHARPNRNWFCHPPTPLSAVFMVSWSSYDDHHMMIIIWWSSHHDHYMMIIIWWSSYDDNHMIRRTDGWMELMIIIWWSSYDDLHMMIVTMNS